MQRLDSRSGIGSADASQSLPTPSRFRKSGLAVAIGATAVLAAAPLKTVNAAIVYNGAVNTTVYSPTDGKGNPNLTGPSTANITVAGTPLFTIFNNTDDKSPPNVFFGLNNLGPTTLVNVTGTTTDGYQLAAKYNTVAATKSNPSSPPSVSIGSTNLFSASSTIYTDYYYGPSNSTTAEDYYIGFQFDPSGDQVDYGWAHFITGADGYNFELVSDAYDDTGAAITTGQTVAASPEPTSLSLLAIGGLGLLSLRRRRGTTATQ